MLYVFANFKYKDIILQRIKEYENLLIPYVIVCIDSELFEFLGGNLSIADIVSTSPNICYNSNIEFYNIDIRNKSTLWCKRIEFLYEKLFEGDILHTDADAIWYKNPFELFEADMCFTLGLHFPYNIYKRWGFVVRGGLYYIKSTEFTIKFFNKLVLYTRKFKDDQVALNILLHNMGVRWEIPSSDIFYYDNNEILCTKVNITGYIGTHKIIILPYTQFPRTEGFKCYAADIIQ